MTALLVALHGDGVRRSPLGVHHQRMLRLHGQIGGRALDAVVTCARCSTENEFAVPIGAICAVPEPATDAEVALAVGVALVRYRLPTLSDLAAISGMSVPEGLASLAARTCLDDEAPELADGDIGRLAEAWEELDPAAAVQVDLVCAECRADVVADVAVAEFVADELDRTVDGLVHQVDVVARAYGWSEDAILALPAQRRRRYVELIEQRGDPSAFPLAAVGS
ncbi:hypothetical protein PHK61_28815 [Actinomycetospora lutea]|uniref:hypothetical protein n=1 Tax=Actinomycetospora lutea TaxID=663604 RepID=UPI002365CD9F|nr:hypothetical protein [Actinomycetospora lutea]MDD7942424.1 hypothetical protein [Actinomycetospora lutea]